MALFPVTKTPYETLPLLTPSSFVGVPAQGGKITTRKQAVAGMQWTETYKVDFSTPTDRGWKAQVQKIFYDGAILTNKAHPYESTLLGAGGGAGKSKGAGQVGSNILTQGWNVSSTPLKAGDVVQFSGLTPAYQVVADVVADAAGAATMSVVPDVLQQYSPADAVSIVSGSNVAFQCVIQGLSFSPLSIRSTDHYSQATVTFRESL